jgi:hypothetical protein
MTQLIVLQSRHDRVLASRDACARRKMPRDAIVRSQVVRLVIRDRRKVGRNILTNLFQIRLHERFDARRDSLVGENDYWSAVFARDVHRFNRRVKTIFHARGRQHHTR